MDEIPDTEAPCRVLKIDYYCSVLSLMRDLPNMEQREERQTKVASCLQEINENLDQLIPHQEQFRLLFSHSLPIMLNYLSKGPKNYIPAHNGHQIRKLILQILYRFPISEIRNEIPTILPTLYQLIEEDNEDNALIALRIIIDFHRKNQQGKMVAEAKNLLEIFHVIVDNFKKNVSKIFKLREPWSVETRNDLNLFKILPDIFNPITVRVQNPQDNIPVLPRGSSSLKLFAEIPATCMAISNLYRNAVDNEMWNMLRMGMEIARMQPKVMPADLANPLFNHHGYVDFVAVQVKYLSLFSYFVKSNSNNIIRIIEPDKVPIILMNLLANCPEKAPHIRKELLNTFRSIISTHYKFHFVPIIEKFLDDKLLIGTGWTSRETLALSAYSIIIDLLLSVREQLNVEQMVTVISNFSRNQFGGSVSLNVIAFRMILKLTDTYSQSAEIQKVDVRPVLFKVFAIFANKLADFVKYVIPALTVQIANSTQPSLPPITTLETLTSSPATPLGGSSSDNAESSDGTPEATAQQAFDALYHEDPRIKIGFPGASSKYVFHECHMLIRTLLNGIKELSIKLNDHSDAHEQKHNKNVLYQGIKLQNQQKAAGNVPQVPHQPLLLTIRSGYVRPKDLGLLIRLFKKGLKVFDFYVIHNRMIANLHLNTTSTVGTTPTNTATNNSSTPKEEEQSAKEKAAPFGGAAFGEKPITSPVNLLPHQCTKDELEMMDSFVTIFKDLPPQTFSPIIRECIEFFVECINANPILNQIANSFLSHCTTSVIFSRCLLDYLLNRMEVMGSNPELSIVYLRLFKSTFGAVQFFPKDNGEMLKPYLLKIVDTSMKLALTAKEPFNYFLILRSLFRSIGGGSHDILYAEFLPMLPSLLQRLNNLQSGIHVQNMKDLFVELCLTIPVRLSSLLPYLPWLMGPIVSALNGTQNLIAQGLRTLELCVDSLKPDFLYEHIQPIQMELMQALWRTLRHPVDDIAQSSFRILGKLGGANHKLMIEPQMLEWIDFRDPATLSAFVKGTADNVSPEMVESISQPHIPSHNAYSFMSIFFAEATINATHPNQHTVNHLTPIHLPIDKVVEAAYKGLRQPTTDTFYRQQCWEITKGFIIAHIQTVSSAEEKDILINIFQNSSLRSCDLPTSSSTSSGDSGSTSATSNLFASTNMFKFPDDKLRKIHELALKSMLTAAAIKELYNTVLLLMIPLVRHYTLVAILQQAVGPGSGLVYTSGNSGTRSSQGSTPKFVGMDPLVLIDAMVAVMGQEETTLCKPCNLVLMLICDTAVIALGNKERASQLPLFVYLLEKLCALCYERPWFSKFGGCSAIRSLLKQMSLCWLFTHQCVILKAMFFVIHDLSSDMSSGVIDMAKENLKTLLTTCAAPLEASVGMRELIDTQRKSMMVTTQELVRLITHHNQIVREEAMHLLNVLAKTTGQSVTEVMLPHKEIVSDFIPSGKHKLFQLPPNIQIGILEGTTFCNTLEPPLFRIDASNQDHLTFFNDVYLVADRTETELQKLNCYKDSASLVPVKKSCLRVLAACHHNPQLRHRIFAVLFKALDSPHSELQECAYQCMKTHQMYKDAEKYENIQTLVRTGIRDLIRNVSDIRTLTPSAIIRLKYIARLFKKIFNEKFCDQFLNHLLRIIEIAQNHIRKNKERDLRLKIQSQQQAALANKQSGSLVQQPLELYETNTRIMQLDVSQQVGVSIEIINLFTEMDVADATYVDHLLKFYIKMETLLDNYSARRFPEPVRKFLKRYPQRTIQLVERYFAAAQVFSFFEYLITGEDGAPFRAVLYENPAKLIFILRNHSNGLGTIKLESPEISEISIMDISLPAGSVGSNAATPAKPSERFHAIAIISILLKYKKDWLNTQPELFQLLRSIWLSDSFHVEHSSGFARMEYNQWKEPKLLAKCLLYHFKANSMTEIDVLYQLLRAFNGKYYCDFEFLRKFLYEEVTKTFSIAWRRAAFLRFLQIFNEEKKCQAGTWPVEIITKIMQFVIIPTFVYSFEKGEVETQNLLGHIEQTSGEEKDLVYLFETNFLDGKLPESIQICCLQLLGLIIDYAPYYVKLNLRKEPNEEGQQRDIRSHQKVRTFLQFTWSSISSTSVVDPANRYYAAMMIGIFLSRMPIHRKIARQVFNTLIKANTAEARPIVRSALEIFARSMKFEDSKIWLVHSTRTAFLEEHHAAQQINVLQVVVRNYRHYFEYRHYLIPFMLNVINKINFAFPSNTDQRRATLDLIEVIVRWEFQRKQNALEPGTSAPSTTSGEPTGDANPHKRSHEKMEVDAPDAGSGEDSKKEIVIGSSQDSITREQAEQVMHILVYFVCKVPDVIQDQISQGNPSQANLANGVPITVDYLGKRALALVKIILQADLWPFREFRINYIESTLLRSKEANTTAVCLTLELLVILLQTMKKDSVLKIFICLQKAISTVCGVTNLRVVRTTNSLLTKLMSIFPPSCRTSTLVSPKSGASVKNIVQDKLVQEPLAQLYTDIHSTIQGGFTLYNRATCVPSYQNAAQLQQLGTQPTMAQPPSAQQLASYHPEIFNSFSSLYRTLHILKAACNCQPSYIDRLLTSFIHMLQKLVKEHLILGSLHSSESGKLRVPATPNEITNLCVELICLGLNLVKNRLGDMSADMRRTLISHVFTALIDKTTDVWVMKEILKIVEGWIKQPQAQQQGRPSGVARRQVNGLFFREIVSLLTRISANIEKRMSEDSELNSIFLDLIYYIYTDDTLSTSDLTAKLEHSFMSGLRCAQPNVRHKFFSIMDKVIRKRLFERLMYIICEQNWESMNSSGMGHYWIKQCIELMLSLANHHLPLSTPNTFATLPLPSSFVNVVSRRFGDKFSAFSSSHSSTAGINSFGMTSDVMDFDFIGTPLKQSVERSAPSNQAEITDLPGATSESSSEEVASGSQQVHYSAAANSFFNDLFGNQSGNSGKSHSTQNESGSVGTGSGANSPASDSRPLANWHSLYSKVGEFLFQLSQNKSTAFINAIAQLCHLDSNLAQHIWVQMFPRIYEILGEKQQQLVALQIAPFFVSGSHLGQREAPISAIGTFFEAIAHCKPAITLRPSIMKYIGKHHNCWHRVSLMLEGSLARADPTMLSIGLGGLLANGTDMVLVPLAQAAVSGAAQKSTRFSSNPQAESSQSAANLLAVDNANSHDVFPAELQQPEIAYSQDCAAALSQVYELLREEDYWVGIWQSQARFTETLIGIAYEQMGYFEQAKAAYELAMTKAKAEYNGTNPAPHILKGEYGLWEQHWIRCSKELNQWDFLLEYGNTPDCRNPWLVMESAWRIPDWDNMHEAINSVEQNVPKELVWKAALYKGFDAICNPKVRELGLIQKLVDMATSSIIKEWRLLPLLVSQIHVEYLHAAHQVMELQEAGLLHQSIFNGDTPPPTASIGPSGHVLTTPVDVLLVIKLWKNRLPTLADDLSHWSDIFTWRQHHYQSVVSRYELEASRPGANPNMAQYALLGGHASAQSLIHFAKIARKHSLVTVSLDSLDRIHTIPKVPIIDFFQKIRQQLKCYLLMHQVQPSDDDLQEGISVIESTNLKFLQREMISELYAMKGHFLMKLGRLDEANRTFSVAVQIQDTLVKAWALWGEYYEEIFTKQPFETRNIEMGVSAITAYLHACRIQNETKARKFLSKVLWLQSFDDEVNTLAKATEKYNDGVPPINWIPWIPQLLQYLVRPENNNLINIFTQISKLYPQAVYYQLRILFLTHKWETRDVRLKINRASQNMGPLCQQPQTDQASASLAMVRMSKIIQSQREVSPTVLYTLEVIIDQMCQLRESNWYEDVVRQLRFVLAKCYSSAYEISNRGNVTEACASTHIIAFVRKLILTFGINVENFVNQRGNDSSRCSDAEALLRRAHATLQDPNCQQLKEQFSESFDFSNPNTRRLHYLILQLKKWINIFEAKIKALPKSSLLEDKCRYLSNFSQQMVEIALPGEFLLPKAGLVLIGKFLPWVEIVSKHNAFARRLHIRGVNGKIYPFLIVTEAGPTETRREERVLQLQRLLNVYLGKHKETARRLLNFTVPRIVSFAPNVRFVEDNTSSLSLLDIYKQYITGKGSDHDAPIARYYEHLTESRAKTATPVTTKDLCKYISDIQVALAPKSLLTDWAIQTYNSAPDFWHFRKQFTLQLGLADFSQYVFHLTRLNPEMVYIHRDTGLVNVSYYRFDLSESTGELTTNHLVPIRLTPAIQDFVTKVGITGPLKATIISTASCLNHPNYKVNSIVCAIVRDEMITWYRRVKSNEKMTLLNQIYLQANQPINRQDSTILSQLQTSFASVLAQPDFPDIGGQDLVNFVNRATTMIMSRISSLSNFDIGSDSKADILIADATSADKLARMDPVWHPWL